jgi:hypothetical protein
METAPTYPISGDRSAENRERLRRRKRQPVEKSEKAQFKRASVASWVGMVEQKMQVVETLA